MPALFVGHGSPMAAIEPDRHTAAWQRVGAQLPVPRAILCISAHWYTRGLGLTSNAHPATIHDFHGFPRALYAVSYPAPGDAALVARVQQLLAPDAVQATDQWGLDHGSWSVLRYLFPDAQVPVVQLSLDGERGARAHYELAVRLRPLRDEGVLILGSGNVVHNLRHMQRHADAPAPDWATSFNDTVRGAILRGDHESLIDYPQFGAAARLSVPTDEHYLPLLYVLAQQQPGDAISLPTDGIELGCVSMLAVQIGAAAA